MPIHALNNTLWFPPVSQANEDGLLAMGGDLSIDRLLLAYKKGIFPWFEGDTPLWWCTDPRFVLYPNELRVSKSMQAVFKKRTFRFTMNQAFSQVIHACKLQKRIAQDGTWITDELENSFNELHKLGFAISAEAWEGKDLVGGLYGIQMGKICFGESMFSTSSNASKFAFISLVNELIKQGITLIDCQVYTAHLESLGARMIDRTDFIAHLEKHI